MKYIAINGYGVPKDIFKDYSYHAYLTAVFNILFDEYRNEELVILSCGGKTDMIKPYRRTEAGEIKKWLDKKMREQKVKKWKCTAVASELSAVENMLAVKTIVKRKSIIYFCEATRIRKMQALARKIFGKGTVVIGIEFDGSQPRYDRTRIEHEAEDLRFSLQALKDPIWRKELQKAAVEKIQVLRTMSPAKRAREVDRIARDIRKKYYSRYTR